MYAWLVKLPYERKTIQFKREKIGYEKSTDLEYSAISNYYSMESNLYPFLKRNYGSMLTTSKRYCSYHSIIIFVYQKLASCVEFKVTVLCGGGSKNGNDNNNYT